MHFSIKTLNTLPIIIKQPAIFDILYYGTKIYLPEILADAVYTFIPMHIIAVSDQINYFCRRYGKEDREDKRSASAG